jgi:hypothetical protein
MVRPGQEALRRKLYRYIAEEKKRLIESGVDVELVRLLCRHLKNPSCPYAEGRYLRYAKQLDLFQPSSDSFTI